MKKLITMILAMLLTLCALASAVAEVSSDPTIGLSIDFPDDWGTRNVAISDISDGEGMVGLAFMYTDYDQLMPYYDALKEAAMNGDDAAMATAYAAYDEAFAKYAVTCAMVIGVPTETAEESLAEYVGTTEGFEVLGSNSTHTYYRQIGIQEGGALEDIIAAAEAELDYITGLVEKTSVIEIEEESEEVSGDAASALLEFVSVDMDGNPVDASLFAEADLTVLNIWGTYCSPCISEMPGLAAWANELPENVQVVGLIVDVSSAEDKTFTAAQKILAKSNVTFVNILYNDSLAGLMTDIIGTPTTLFLDSNGNQVAEAVVGADMDAYKAAVEAFLAN